MHLTNTITVVSLALGIAGIGLGLGAVRWGDVPAVRYWCGLGAVASAWCLVWLLATYVVSRSLGLALGGIIVAVILLIFGIALWPSINRLVSIPPLRPDSLRAQAFAFWKEMRAFYEANERDAEMPTEFYKRFSVRINEFKERFRSSNVRNVHPFSYDWLMDASHIRWVINTFHREAAQVEADILA